ncbi:hypothetical protein C2E23DRAFT_860417 [Lenzites betulinus]|nr:hypothetical protein C2E23DRAFT_860417 [Lenzites betulinus]
MQGKKPYLNLAPQSTRGAETSTTTTGESASVRTAGASARTTNASVRTMAERGTAASDWALNRSTNVGTERNQGAATLKTACLEPAESQGRQAGEARPGVSTGFLGGRNTRATRLGTDVPRGYGTTTFPASTTPTTKPQLIFDIFMGGEAEASSAKQHNLSATAWTAQERARIRSENAGRDRQESPPATAPMPDEDEDEEMQTEPLEPIEWKTAGGGTNEQDSGSDSEDEEAKLSNEEARILAAAKLRLRVMETPKGGFPEVFGKATVTTAEALAITKGICTIVSEVTGLEQDEYVVDPPAQKPSEAMSWDAPTAWPITGISELGTKLLVSQRVWGPNPITVIFHDGEPKLPRFLLATTGFTQLNNVRITAAIKAQLLKSPIINWMMDYVSNNPKYKNGKTPEIDVVKKIVNSLKAITRVKDTKDLGEVLVTYIYMKSPTEASAKWVEWRSLLRAAKITGTATSSPRPLTRCAGCHGVNHEYEDCPFTHLAAWQGPRAPTHPEEVAQNWMQATTERGAARGGRAGFGAGGQARPHGAASGRGGPPLRTQQYQAQQQYSNGQFVYPRGGHGQRGGSNRPDCEESNHAESATTTEVAKGGGKGGPPGAHIY